MKPADLIDLAEQMLAGLSDPESGLTILDVTPESFTPVLNGFTDAQAAYQTARAAELAASRAAIAADAEIEAWLYKARGILTCWLGTRWTTMWAATGYVNGSTAVPETVPERFGLVMQLANYFAANPDHAVPGLEVTAQRASALVAAASGARAAANAASGDRTVKLAARDAAGAALRRVMRGLIGILGMKLDADDPRWLLFGLNTPGAATTPAQPEQVTAQAMPGGAILAKCAPVPLATGYRWRVKVAGVDTEFRLAATTAQPLAKIGGLTAGAGVELCVQAVNGSLQSVPSARVEVVVPAAAFAAPRLLSAVEVFPKPQPAIDRPAFCGSAAAG